MYKYPGNEGVTVSVLTAANPHQPANKSRLYLFSASMSVSPISVATL